MSVACESIANEDEISHSIANTQNNDKDSYEEEELDYEEEMDDAKSGNNNQKSEEEGEVSDNSTQDVITSKKRLADKDEGELDEDEELEEGEVKEEEEENIQTSEAKPELEDGELNKNGSNQDDRNLTRHETVRHAKIYYNTQRSNSSQNYTNSRYAIQNRNDRYSSNRNRDYNPPAPSVPQSTSESAWERGLKQARELLSKASKRKEEEVDFDNKRFNLTVDSNNAYQQQQPQLLDQNRPNREVRERSPVKRRRYSSQHSSSEDEVERRHRLAYDAAPWNNPNSSTYQTSNYRNSRSNYSTNRTAETYRDPWRRSKSPKPASNRSRRPDDDTRYGEIYKKEKINSDSRRSNSMSSLSSIGSNSSNFSEKSAGRKLPYSRPNLDPKNRHEREGVDKAELPYRNEYPKSRMDRIPKKPNASSHNQSNDRISEAKSFDSWSESLSESDSSSFFSNSDSDSDDSDADISARDKSSRISKKLSEKRSQAKLSKQQKDEKAALSSLHSKHLTRDAKNDPKGTLAHSKMSSKSVMEKEANKKLPIKMTFLKTQPSLKKDRLIDEQLNGGTFELEDLEANNSRSSKISSNKSVASKSQSEDEESKNLQCGPKDSPSSSTSSSNKMNRREELLLKLKAVEEAIERKLNSKKE